MKRALRFTLELMLFIPLLVFMCLAWLVLKAAPGLYDYLDDDGKLKPPRED